MANEEPPPHESQLPDGWRRFLAHAIEHGFTVGRREPEDFIRHFPPSAIMEGLEDESQRRANILVICTGVRMKIAIKKSHASCAEDLQIALDEDETDAETVVTLFDPDDRVLYLDQRKLWAYVTEGEFWNDEGSKNAREHVAYMLQRALQDELITHREIVEGISTAKMARLLPREELGRMIAAALEMAHDGKPFDEKKMLEMVPPATLVEAIPLRHLWEKVVVPKIAERHGLQGGEEADEDEDADEETLMVERKKPAPKVSLPKRSATAAADDGTSTSETDAVEVEKETLEALGQAPVDDEEEKEDEDLDLAIDDLL